MQIRRFFSRSHRPAPWTRQKLPRSIPLAIATSLALFCLGGCAETEEDRLETIREQHENGLYEESIPLLIEMIEGGSRNGEVLFRYGRALSKTGKHGRALWTLDAAMDHPEWIVPAAHQLATDAYQSENFELALQVLDRLDEERPDPETMDLTASLLRSRVYIGTRSNYEDALDVLDSILDQNPDSEEAVRLKAVALLGLKQPDLAFELIQEGAELAGENDLGLTPGGRDAYWCSIRASFMRESGELARAEEILDECLTEDPAAMALVSEAIELHSKQEHFARILEILEAAYDAEPESRDFRLALVLQLRGQNRSDEAEALLREATESEDETVAAGAWIDLAGFLVESGRVSEGIEAYEKALSGPDVAPPPELLFTFAEALILDERFEDALAIADATPVEVHGPMLRGRIAYERGDYETARRELQEAARIWPNNAPVRYYLARTAEAFGDFDEAIEEYRQAMRSDTSLDAARERLVKLHLAEGRPRHANTILRFTSPRQFYGNPSVETRLLQIRIQAQLGSEPDITNLPHDPERSVDEIRSLALAAYAKGIWLRVGPEATIKALRLMEESSSDSAKGMLLRERVDALLRFGQTEEAVEAARAASRARPQDDHVRIALARALTVQVSESGVGESAGASEAEALLSGLRDRRPKDANVRAVLGKLAYATGDPTRALSLYEEALDLDPAHQKAIFGLVDALGELERSDEARKRLEVYLARHQPYDGSAALRLARLLESQPGGEEERARLARRALRFGGGEPALELLATLDPTIAEAIARTRAETGEESIAEEPVP